MSNNVVKNEPVDHLVFELMSVGITHFDLTVILDIANDNLARRDSDGDDEQESLLGRISERTDLPIPRLVEVKVKLNNALKEL